MTIHQHMCVIHIWMNYTELYLFFFRPLKYVLNIHSKLLLIFFCINFLSLFHLGFFVCFVVFDEEQTVFTHHSYWEHRHILIDSRTVQVHVPTRYKKFNLANDHSEKFSSDYNLIKMISIQVFLLISLTTIEVLAYGKQKNIPKWKKQVNNKYNLINLYH